MGKVFYIVKGLIVIGLLFLGMNDAIQPQLVHLFSPSLLQTKIDLVKNTNDVSEKITMLAESFVGTPYLSNPIDDKKLIRLDSFDCWTFVETTTAIALTSTIGGEQSYKKVLTRLRYRNGINNGFVSRLNYFTNWVNNLENRNVAIDLSKKMGGIAVHKHLSYISDNFSSNATDKEYLKTIENKLNSKPIYYIPLNQIESIECQLLNGDIIGFVSNRSDLDVNHMGFIKKSGVNNYILHCSSQSQQVELSNAALTDYIKPDCIGIIVVRLTISK